MGDTDIALRDFIQQEINSLSARLTEYMASHRREQDLALAAMEKRLESMNEFRATIKDAQALYMSRAEWESAHRDLTGRLQTLETNITKRLELFTISLAEKVSRDKVDSIYRIVYMAVGMALLSSILIPIGISLLRGK